jgi:aminomethyltransferase
MLDLAYPSVVPGPPRRVLTPEGVVRHHGLERYSIPGGGAALLQLMTGDRLTLINDEGGQPAEIVVAARDAGSTRPFSGGLPTLPPMA